MGGTAPISFSVVSGEPSDCKSGGDGTGGYEGAGSWPGTRLPGCFRAAGAGCWRALSWTPVKFGCTTYWGGAYMMLFRNRFCGASFLVGQGRGCSTMLPDLDVNPGTGYLDAAAPPLSPPPRAHRRPPSKECVDGRAVFAQNLHSLPWPHMGTAGAERTHHWH